MMIDASVTKVENNQQAISWARDYLTHHGFSLKSPLESVRIMPWSQVYRVLSSSGYIYLKKMSPPFAVEANILIYLSKQVGRITPKVIAYNKDLRAFLMTDSGIPLRNFLKNSYQMDITCKALDIYATIQRGIVGQIDDLIALGVPDWRLAVLPSLFQNLLCKSTFLNAEGLTPDEIEKLQNLQPKFADLCHALSCYRIPETIEHGDFHDNNILLQDDDLRINDWGDTTISHPFFSLVSFLKSAIRNHDFAKISHEYHEMQNRYLNKWSYFEPKCRLLEAFELTQHISPVKFAISFYRITLCSGIDQLEQYQGVIKKALQSFMKVESQKANKLSDIVDK